MRLFTTAKWQINKTEQTKQAFSISRISLAEWTLISERLQMFFILLNVDICINLQFMSEMLQVNINTDTEEWKKRL